MKRQLVILLLTVAAAVSLSSCSATRKLIADRETLQWRYEIEAVEGQAPQGVALVKVWTYSKDRNIPLLQAGKNAVHAVLFSGIPEARSADGRILSGAQPRLVQDSDAETTHENFIKTFFKDGGQYQKYVTYINNGTPSPGDVVKIKKEYKIGVKVSVAKSALRKDMEAAGLVKALGAGF